ncbi:hypothetical protein [Nocardia sp. NPDC059239]|uniref:hypothetical protein n=1 Tax=unclassified Nocardia TaxID=2637762 RepID=UPI0036BB62BD
MIEPVVRTDVAVVRGIGFGMALLPLGFRLMLLAGALLVAMAGCTGAWIQQQHYVPSPNVCRADEVGVRTDCIPRAQLTLVPDQAGAQR